MEPSSGLKRGVIARMAVLFIIISFVINPLVPVFAQETEETPSNVSTPTDSPSENIEQEVPETETLPEEEIETPSEEQAPEGEDPLDEETEEEIIPEEEMAMAMAGIDGPRSLTLSSSAKNSLTPGIDEMTGALIYTYPINVPPGRNNLAPDLSLIYNSATSANDSVVGSGWSVNIPYIERINRKGTNTLYSENYYNSSLDGELIALNSTDYVAKIEKGDFRTYTKLTNGWEVVDKDGAKFTFGLNAQARQDNSANTTQIFKWMLEEVRDTNDNYISYAYYKDAGQIYPSQIVYTGNGSNPGVFEVNFDRTSRSNAPTLYNTAFSVKSNYRITEIRTEVNNVWARKYTLAYTTGDNGGGSFLDTVVESGQDDSSNVTTLPSLNFDYQTSTVGWTKNTAWSNDWATYITPFLSSGADTGMRMTDINGDGLQDAFCHNNNVSGTTPCTKNGARVWLNNGDGTWNNVSGTWLFPLIGGAGSDREYFLSTTGGTDRGLRAMDLNGDALADLVMQDYVYLNTGSGWTKDTTWSNNFSTYIQPFVVSGADTGVRTADLNGDGLLDLFCHNGNSGGSTCANSQPRVWLNNGDGTWNNVSSTWLFPLIGGTGSTREYFLNTSGGTDRGLRAVDLNGDLLTDLVMQDYVYINNGNGWTYNSTWSNNFATYIQPFTSSGADTGIRANDINGDGLLDIFCHNNNAGSSACDKSQPRVWMNNGENNWNNISSTWLFPLIGGAGSDKEYFLSTSGGTDRGLRTVDLNGDSLPDLVMQDYIYLNNTSVQANLLKKITFSQGGNTQITYKATSQYRNGSGVLNPSLPLTFDVVDQIVTNDGSGTTESVAYEYEGGDYYYNNALDRRFAGFNSIKATDAAGNVKKTFFYQGNSTNTALGEYNDHAAKIGMPYRLEEYDNSSNLYRLTVDQIDRYNIGTDHDFIKTIRRTVLDYDGNGGHKDSSTEYSYDNSDGNILTVTEWGEVTGSTDGSFSDTGSDKRITTYTYAINGTTLVNVPYNATVTDSSAAKVAESKYYYDAQSYGSVIEGNQTKVEQWVTGGTYINSQKTYDSTYGLVATSTDPRGKVTTYTTYDAYDMYPITITDPLSETTQYVYDYSLGKPKQVTNQNGFDYDMVYDGLDRLTTEQIPDFTSGSVTKTAYTYTDTSGAVSVNRTDYLTPSVNVESYQYFDGLGRLIQERKEAESNYNVIDTVYNNIGSIQKQSLPYNSSGSSKTSATGTSSLYITNTYDPLYRVLTTVDAAGTTTYAYDEWKTTITDAENNVKKYYKDSYNNLVKVDEVNGMSTYTTDYEWNLNNKLTKITDALNNFRNFTYDGLGRRLTAEDLHASADGTFGTWAYVYDDAGNITQTVSPNSLTTNYTYNDINQLLTEDYTGVGGTEITYVYGGGCTNGIEKLCSVTMSSGVNTTYTYDTNGNVSSETKTINSTPYTTSYTYDRYGNKLIVTYPDSAEVKYTFNSAGLLEKIEHKESGGSFSDVISDFDYSPMDQVTEKTYVNGVITTNTYDATELYRLTRRLTENAAPIKLQDLNYTYDNVGNITQIIDASDTDSSKTANYVYDDLNRMISATVTSVAVGQTTYTHTYVYDALGNITSGPIGSYTYAGTNYANPHAATTINSVTYTYDNNGNLTGNGTLANTWNYKNQLTQAVVSGITSDYTYDHVGERASLDNGTITTLYPNDYYNTDGTKQIKAIYAGDQLIATLETVSGTVTPFYIHTDYLGSTNTSSNSSGFLVETLDYYPYGAKRISSGSHTDQRQYIGQIYDIDTGLDYLNARYYKADIARFISQDSMFWKLPINILIDPQQQNSYSYARNNPINMKDPSGNITVNTMLKNAVKGLKSLFSKPTSSNKSKAEQPAPFIGPIKPPSNSKPASLSNPVGNAPVTSKFMADRSDCSVCSKTHGGTDYGVGTGTPVQSTAPGNVARAGWSTTLGNTVVVEHIKLSSETNGVYTLYGHGSSLNVKVGQKVDTGDTLMYSGNTGSSSTKPHLHYEVIKSPFEFGSEDFYHKDALQYRYAPQDLSTLLE